MSDIIKNLLKESEAYHQLEDLEKFVEGGNSLSSLPVQPLYLMIRGLNPEALAPYLSRFSKIQREAFLDLDLWEKDELDTSAFSHWLATYALSSDEKIFAEFVQSSQFLLYLKGKFHISTFDQEDPQYPEHDHFFLTDDSLLLVEYEEDYPYVNELKRSIRELYQTLGVEGAYTFLFKVVSENYSVLEEDEFRLKKERQRDLGFVDYYEALEMTSSFANTPVMENFIKKKIPVTGNLDEVAILQSLHKSSLVPYKNGLDEVSIELEKVKDAKRRDYLQFNFVRMVNANLALESALKEGSLSMSKAGEKSKALILLGFNVIKKKFLTSKEDSLFERFDFLELLRVGKTLIESEQKKMKKALQGTPFKHDYESFLGSYWEEFLDHSFDSVVKFRWPFTLAPKEVTTPDMADLWARRARTFVELLPFAKKFFEVFLSLRETGRIQSDFYLNYNLDDIDLEAILLSSFANFSLGNLKNEAAPKLGLTLDEFKVWISKVIDAEGKLKRDSYLNESIEKFSKSFGLGQVYDFPSYFTEILKDQLEGYEYEKLSFEDFKHVGGPIILSLLRN